MKTWLITGCSEGGIGAGIAKNALERGYNVVVTARNTDKVKNIVAKYPETALAVVLDVTDKNSIKNCVKTATDKFGKIDVLVNNAGYAYRSSIEAIESDETPLRLLLGTDAISAVRGALNARLNEIDKWEKISVKTDY